MESRGCKEMTPQERVEKILGDWVERITDDEWESDNWEVGSDFSMAKLQDAMMQAITAAGKTERERVIKLIVNSNHEQKMLKRLVLADALADAVHVARKDNYYHGRASNDAMEKTLEAYCWEMIEE